MRKSTWIWIIAIALAVVLAIAVGWFMLNRDKARPDPQDWHVVQRWAASTMQPVQLPEPYYVRLTGKLIEHSEWGHGYRVRIEGQEPGLSFHMVSEFRPGRYNNQFSRAKVGDTLTVEGWVRGIKAYNGNRVDFALDWPKVVEIKGAGR